MQQIRNYTLTLCFLLLSSIICAQGVAIGEWRTHLPYQRVIDIDVVGSKIYAATPYTVFYYDKEDNNVTILDKISGLSDVGVRAIRYNKDAKIIMVAYSNTNIDLIYENGSVYNMSDIKDKEIIGNKTINSIYFHEKLAYLACGFGIVVIDLSKLEVKDTYIIGNNSTYINVNSVVMHDNKLFAATESGIYYASLDSPNLSDFSQWTKDQRLIHPNLPYNPIISYEGKLLANYASNTYNSDTIFVLENGEWDYFTKNENYLCRQMRVCNNKLVISNQYHVSIFNNQYETEYTSGWTESMTAILDAENQLWIGSRTRGLLYMIDAENSKSVRPNGPGSANTYEMVAGAEHVWVASGGHSSVWAKLWMRDGVFQFDGNWWQTYNSSTPGGLDTITDFICVAVDPNDGSKAYVGTWQAGVVAFENGEVNQIYSAHNSTLSPWIANTALVNISGLRFDSRGNLWAANTGTTNLLSMMTPSKVWKSFHLGGTNSGIDIGPLMIDKNDYKWIIRRDNRIIVFNDNETFDNSADDQVAVLGPGTGSGNIHGNVTYCTTVDLDGTVWIGTDNGPATLYNSAKIFQSGQNYDAIRILVPRNDGSGQADPLLEGQKILCIAVDGANNKWFGTENGVFHLSSNGLEELHYFNTDNSPLLSNTVSSIAINNKGEVFFGTGNGIISYRAVATPSEPENSDVYAFPNPVHRDYLGPVAIKGVVSGALLKITTVNGSLISHVRAEGGQAVWDGRALNGKEVEPGIYLVFVSTDDGRETLVTKILMMR
ncbi:MAG: hypothetical protein LBM67_05935 [Lentimicrobiaceae bacterium]|jgi:ligand-binding sensor domain-containing protein|nr:hypothetical protein [Lentimicrobiaceae bacterium]